MGINDGEGRGPKLVLERSITDGTGRAIAEGRNDGAKILWKRDFLKGPRRRRSRKSIKCLREGRPVLGLGELSWIESDGEKASVLSLERDSRGSSINWKRRDGSASGGIGDSKIVGGQQKRGRSPKQDSQEQGQRDAVPRESISIAM